MEDKQSVDTQEVARPKSKRKKSFFMLFLIVVLLGGASFAYYVLFLEGIEETDDAYVNGDMVILSPQITGTVTQVAVDDGDYVKKGQVLVTLDASDTEIALQTAEAQLASAVREVRGLYANVDNFRAQVQAKKVKLSQATHDYDRRVKLFKKGAISVEDLVHYKDTLEVAKSELNAAEKSLETNLAIVDDTVIDSHPEIKYAIANLRQRHLNNARTHIVAPVNGHVAKRAVQLGSRVQQGATLMTIIPLDEVWVDVNFKESQMKAMRIGQPVELTSDLYGDNVVYQGKIESLGMGTGSAFSLLPAQNASGNWIKIVQRVPVKVVLKKEQLEKHPLRIGLSMLAKVDITNEEGPLLSQKPRETARYNTDVYELSQKEVNALIAKILHENAGVVELEDSERLDISPAESK